MEVPILYKNEAVFTKIYTQPNATVISRGWFNVTHNHVVSHLLIIFRKFFSDSAHSILAYWMQDGKNECAQFSESKIGLASWSLICKDTDDLTSNCEIIIKTALDSIFWKKNPKILTNVTYSHFGMLISI